MTASQAIAMAFPLFTLAGVGLIALFVVKPWKRMNAKRALIRENSVAKAIQSGILEDLEQADRLIQKSRQELTKAG